jgi:hypothetical protein
MTNSDKIIDSSNATINWMMIHFKYYLDKLNNIDFDIHHRLTRYQISEMRDSMRNMNSCINTIEYHNEIIDRYK